MKDLFIIPQANNSIIAKIENGQIVKAGDIDLPYNSRTVQSENGHFVTICFEPKEIRIHDLQGNLKGFNNQFNFNAIAAKGNIIYLGGSKKKKSKAGELCSLINLESINFDFKQIELPIKTVKEKSIDDIVVVGNTLILLDNFIFPKYVFEYDISISDSPVYIKTINLPKGGTNEHIIKGDANEDLLIVFSSTMGMGGKGTLISILDRKVEVETTEKLTKGHIAGGGRSGNYIKDFCLSGNNLVVLRTKDLSYANLEILDKKIELTEIATQMMSIDKLIKSPDNRIIAVNESEYELVDIDNVRLNDNTEIKK